MTKLSGMLCTIIFVLALTLLSSGCTPAATPTLVPTAAPTVVPTVAPALPPHCRADPCTNGDGDEGASGYRGAHCYANRSAGGNRHDGGDGCSRIHHCARQHARGSHRRRNEDGRGCNRHLPGVSRPFRQARFRDCRLQRVAERRDDHATPVCSSRLEDYSGMHQLPQGASSAANGERHRSDGPTGSFVVLQMSPRVGSQVRDLSPGLKRQKLPGHGRARTMMGRQGQARPRASKGYTFL